MLVFCFFSGILSVEAGFAPVSKLYVNGSLVTVRWTDGDTFKVYGPRYRGLRARLKDYNTLENYGPVHKWGSWKPKALLRVANGASAFARSKAWKCFTLGRSGGYGRSLVSCPGLAKALIRRGLAHVFSMRGPGNKSLLAIQKKAISKGRGIWAKGVPRYIVTSVHSYNPRYRTSINRLISTKTGASWIMRHRKRYRSCQWVCAKGSCMRFVPHWRRYGYRKAKCLR